MPNQQTLNQAWKDRHLEKLFDGLSEFLDQLNELNDTCRATDTVITIMHLKSEMTNIIDGVEYAISMGYLVPQHTTHRGITDQEYDEAMNIHERGGM